MVRRRLKMHTYNIDTHLETYRAKHIETNFGVARVFGRESEEKGRGLKGPVHHALDTLEIEVGEIAIAIADWLSHRESTHTHHSLTQRHRHAEREGERD